MSQNGWVRYEHSSQSLGLCVGSLGHSSHTLGKLSFIVATFL